MSSEFAIRVEDLSKCYHIYEQPRDRLKQFVLPRVRGLCGLPPRQYFREFWALRNISFEVNKGETIGIVGRNGSGKSTLLQIISGTLNQTSGTIQTNGRIAALLELGSGFNPEFTGRENVYMNGAVLGLTRQQIDERFDSIAAFADIGEFIEQPVKTYSSGMMVRLAFAVAVSVDPQILIVDEALSVGDERFQRKCFSRIEAIRSAGATILFVSHSGGTVVELCDRAVLLDAGERIAMGAPKRIIAQYQKLLYVPEERRAEVRGAIKAEAQAPAGVPVTYAPSGEPEPRASEPTAADTYDPALQPASTVAYESHGVEILDPEIQTLDGERVNNLRRGGSYRYRYRTRFERSASNVRFGMMIKTTSGVEIGGAASAANIRSSLPFATSGAVFDVEFRFECHLNAGVYFLNAGVVGESNGSEVYLHRLVDVAMFRVMPEAESTATGVVDFLCVPRVHARQM